jgi:hypothetical protein
MKTLRADGLYFVVAGGARIDTAIDELIGRANVTGQKATAIFNEIELQAAPGDSPEKLRKLYGRERLVREQRRQS